MKKYFLKKFKKVLTYITNGAKINITCCTEENIFYNFQISNILKGKTQQKNINKVTNFSFAQKKKKYLKNMLTNVLTSSIMKNVPFEKMERTKSTLKSKQ